MRNKKKNKTNGKMLLADRCLYENYKWAYQNGCVAKTKISLK